MSHEVLPSHMTITPNSHALCMTKNITRISDVNTSFPGFLPAPSPRFSFANVLPTSVGARQCLSLANKSVSEIHVGEIHTKQQGGVEDEGGLVASREGWDPGLATWTHSKPSWPGNFPNMFHPEASGGTCIASIRCDYLGTSSYQLLSLSGRRGLLSNNAGSHASRGISSDSRGKLKTLSEVLLPFIASSLGYLLKREVCGQGLHARNERNVITLSADT